MLNLKATGLRPRFRGTVAALVITLALSSPGAARATPPAPTEFPPGSLIIPMDVDYQDDGMLEAFGLLYQLLLHGVPVHWVIEPFKTIDLVTPANSGVDLVADATDFETGADVPPHGYRGGPFVVHASAAAAAWPIIQSWQASHVTTVHVAESSFSGVISKTMVVAPNIGVFADGNEDIAFGYLNAAGIPDSLGDPWTVASPDALDLVEVKGPSNVVHNDGSLFDADGDPVYCQLMSMHWGVKDAEKPDGIAVVGEVRSFLQFRTHFFAECQAVNAYENSVNGLFLTTAGYDITGDPAPVTPLNSWYPFAQLDGPFQTVGGSERSYTLSAGSQYKDRDIVMLTKAGTTPLTGNTDLWMTGYLDGVCSIEEYGLCADGVGKVSYLGGHRYQTATPISANPDTQGTRLFLNSLFEADCVIEEAQPWVRLSKSAPAYVTTPQVTFTIQYGNYGQSTALGVVLQDTLPAGTAFVGATGGGTEAGGVVTWDLGNLGVMETGAVTVTVALPGLGAYDNTCSASYRSGNTPQTASCNQVTVTYDTDSDGDGCSDDQEAGMGTDPGLADTDGDGTNDCDDTCPTLPNPAQDLQTDPLNCGACGNACVLANATSACVGGHCRVASCNAGYEDCDLDPTNGCEDGSPPCDFSGEPWAQIVKPNILIVFDTSGSMLEGRCDGQDPPVGDGADGVASRIFNLKEAMRQALYFVGVDEANFGLMRFPQYENACELDSCDFDGTTAGYYRIGPLHTGGANANPGCVMSTHRDETTYGAWFDSGVSEVVLVPVTRPLAGLRPGAPSDFDPSDANIPTLLGWLDHRTQCAAGTIFDPEVQAIRWQYTGLGRSLFYARMYFDDYVIPNDPRAACRQNIIILITDGEETCDNALASMPAEPTTVADCAGGDEFNPTRQACLLNVADPPGHPQSIKTYVITQTGLAGANDAIARAGGTGSALEADFTDQDQVKAALLSIIADALPAVETCNGVDDNCNGLVDEGVSNACPFDPVGLTHCAVELCNGVDDDCDGQVDEGYPPNACGGPCGEPVPAEIICNGVDDDCDSSTPDVPDPCACAIELCDGVDNYCDGWSSHAEGAEDPRVGQACGTAVGACSAGTTYCWQDPGDPSHVEIRCTGTGPTAEVCDANLPGNDQNCNGVNNDGVPPQPCDVTNSYGTCDGSAICDVDGNWVCQALTPGAEVCNAVDDNCNGLVDEGLTRPCQNLNGFGACVGTEACSAGAWVGCDAGTPGAEVCNGVDDNCNGLVDEGLTRPCYTGAPGTEGVGVCHGGVQVCSAGAYGACLGEQTPQAGVCDGLDNDCDGQVDEADEVSGEVGLPCGQGGACDNGQTACVNGQLICVGGGTTSEEVCDGVDNDCDGEIDNGAICPPYYHCVEAECRPGCDPTSEFPCPGRLQCVEAQSNGGPVDVCMPDEVECGDTVCPAGWRCENDVCVDPCDPNPCQSWEACVAGSCSDVSCSGLGQRCATGEFCWSHQCWADPCGDAGCDASSEYCARDCDAEGCSARCEPLCDCRGDQYCDATGACVDDPCEEALCDAGQRCVSETGLCEPDPCTGVLCPGGERCYEGECIDDPCVLVQCPAFFRCALRADPAGTSDASAVAFCAPDEAFWVSGEGISLLATGQGGCDCATGGGGSPGGSLLWMLVLGGLWWRRRRAGKAVRR